MNKIEADELYHHLSAFLKTKGIEFQEGSYTKRIRQGCGLLTDAVNLTQQTVEKAKKGMDAKLDKMRQVIHEKTAPKPPPATEAPPVNAAPAVPTVSPANQSNTTTAKTKRPKARPAQKPSQSNQNKKRR